jgi:hypothetical protein
MPCLWTRPYARTKGGSMSTELVASEHGELSATLFGSSDPEAALQQMTLVARTLADVVRQQNLVVKIGQSEHVRVEGWSFLGSLLGVFPVVTWTRPFVADDGNCIGWEARVEARTRQGEVVGAAESECLRSEADWSYTPVSKYGKPLKPRDDYALRSMAQTRAVSKALRLPLGFVMQLAGFNPTPAEEMVAPTVDMYDPDIPFGDAPQPEHQPPASAAQKKKLNVLVGKLRPEQVSTQFLWEVVKREPVLSEDGELHWSPLRDSLTKVEASKLIESLGTLEALSSSGEPTADASGHGESPDRDVSQPAIPDEAASPDEILSLSARLIGSSSDPQVAAYIEQHASTHTPEDHLAWLLVQARKRFGGDAT